MAAEDVRARIRAALRRRRRVRYEPGAADELAPAIASYEDGGGGLGEALLEVENVIEQLMAEPVVSTPVPGVDGTMIRRVML